jgi:hypothetical protein
MRVNLGRWSDSKHSLAGAGEMVTLLIDTELGLEDKELSEDIKRCPLQEWRAYCTYDMKMVRNL